VSSTGWKRTGLVRRVRPEHDRRSVFVLLTEQGRETMQRARRYHREGIEQHFSSHLNDADIRALTRALEKISSHARPSAQDASAASTVSVRTAKTLAHDPVSPAQSQPKAAQRLPKSVG
jgi:DNA-binding PadR family transcriptional regulator